MDDQKFAKSNPIDPDVWVKHFCDLFVPHPKLENDHIIHTLIQNMEQEKVFNELSFRISANEIRKAVSKLKCGKTSGIDSISSEILKSSIHVILPCLTNSFNNILSTGEYLTLFHKGIIVPIQKKGDIYNPDNYRGITLSSNVAKVFSHILYERLTLYFTKNLIIDERQSGFMKGARTADNILLLKVYLKNTVSRKRRNLLHVLLILEKRLTPYGMRACCINYLS